MADREKLKRRARWRAKKMRRMVRTAEKRGRLLPSEAREFDRLEKETRELVERVEETRPPPPSCRRWRESIRPVALHEASHGLLAHLMSYRVVSIELFQDASGRPTGGGRCRYDRRGRPRSPVASLAGWAAQRLAKPARERRPIGSLTLKQMLREGGNSDWRSVRAELSRADGSPGRPRTIEEARMEAIASVRENWGCIEAIADALVEAPGGKLDGRKVHNLCRQHRVSWMPGQY